MRSHPVFAFSVRLPACRTRGGLRRAHHPSSHLSEGLFSRSLALQSPARSCRPPAHHPLADSPALPVKMEVEKDSSKEVTDLSSSDVQTKYRCAVFRSFAAPRAPREAKREGREPLLRRRDSQRADTLWRARGSRAASGKQDEPYLFLRRRCERLPLHLSKPSKVYAAGCARFPRVGATLEFKFGFFFRVPRGDDGRREPYLRDNVTP
jgi:hypothetical protein